MPPSSRARDRRAARRRAAWRRRRLVLVLMSPWIVGFTVFFVYPLLASVYLSFTHYDLLSPPRWVGIGQLRVHVPARPAGLARGPQHAVADGLRRAAAGHVRVRRRGACSRGRRPASGSSARSSICRRWRRRSRRRSGFVYILNPATGPVNTLLSWSASRARCGSSRPTWSKPSLTLLGLWGIGNMMIIFLAALLDVPRHLYESAAARRRRAAWQRLRWVTLPSISPVLLFAVVIGVIEALQYFTQAYVASSIVGGGAGRRGGPANRLGYPEGSTMFYPRPALPAGLPLLQHGLRVGDGDRAVRRRLRGHARASSATRAAGCTTRGGAVSAAAELVAARAAAALARRRPPRAGAAAGAC